MTKKLTQEEFIARAKAVHGDKYDYSLVEYTRSINKVNIICLDHGVFEQEANSHLQGSGCIICSGTNKSNTVDFIEKAQLVHGDRYGYRRTLYTTAIKKVVITCKLHGDFEQSPTHHLSGKGCVACGIQTAKISHRLSFSEFKEKSNLVHNNKYLYVEGSYTNASTFTEIVCPEHGSFTQIPTSHMSGCGCAKCTRNAKSNTLDFVTKATVRHSGFYDYSLVNYTGANYKVTILCNLHGTFDQKASHHLDGVGCPSCAKSGFDKNKPADFYVYRDATFVGYGVSNEFNVRHTNHTRNFIAAGVYPILVQTFPTDGHTAYKLELAVKKHFKLFRINTGIEGFRTEALLPDQLQPLLDFVDDYLQKETP